MSRPDGYFWTEKEKELLKEAWAKGWPASSVALLLNRTRNMIMGKVRRMGLHRRTLYGYKPIASHPKNGRIVIIASYNPNFGTAFKKFFAQYYSDAWHEPYSGKRLKEQDIWTHWTEAPRDPKFTI